MNSAPRGRIHADKNRRDVCATRRFFRPSWASRSAGSRVEMNAPTRNVGAPLPALSEAEVTPRAARTREVLLEKLWQRRH
jgi:hypothetical protein